MCAINVTDMRLFEFTENVKLFCSYDSYIYYHFSIIIIVTNALILMAVNITIEGARESSHISAKRIFTE